MRSPNYLTMETITGSYLPLAGRDGTNTIRKLSAKYADLLPGDIVTMEYRTAIGAPAFATETLKVASVARHWSLAETVLHHGGDNHGLDYEGHETYDESRVALEAHLAKLYGVEPGDTVEFIAIYFE